MINLHYDLCVIGGGINGAAIARDAAGRGLSVLLVEAEDLAGATSSASTKLIHGGIRYLENYEFGMVRKALLEREVLLQNAPHLVWPIRCVIPHDDDTRPQWLMRIGLFLYDNLIRKRSMPRSSVIAAGDDVMSPLADQAAQGFAYSDCWCDDTRLTVLNAVDAASRNATIKTRTRCEKLEIQDGHWKVSLREEGTEKLRDVSASMIVNATGPWVDQFLKMVGIGNQDPDLPSLRMVKGSHIILPRRDFGAHNDKTYVLQMPDKRIVFVAPYEGDYTLVGTTEETFEGNPREARISDAETRYLIDAYNAHFKEKIALSDVTFTFSGIRPLIEHKADETRKLSRDYTIFHHKRYDLPLLSVYGGKLTTHRALAESVVNRLVALSGRSAKPWTVKKALAGGDMSGVSFETFVAQQKKQYAFLPDALLLRYARAYGTRMDFFLTDAETLGDLGTHYGDDVYEAELTYLKKHEWAQSAEDVLWRRSKLGLHVSDATIDAVEAAFTKPQPAKRKAKKPKK